MTFKHRPKESDRLSSTAEEHLGCQGSHHLHLCKMSISWMNERMNIPSLVFTRLSFTLRNTYPFSLSFPVGPLKHHNILGLYIHILSRFLDLPSLLEKWMKWPGNQRDVCHPFPQINPKLRAVSSRDQPDSCRSQRLALHRILTLDSAMDAGTTLLHSTVPDEQESF